MGTGKGCSIASSNCIVWQGSDIPCIGLKNGDSITEAIEKLALELCSFTEINVDITSVDFKCLVDAGESNPTIISEALQLIIDGHCSLKEIVDGIVPGGDPILQLPPCLQEGGVTELPHTSYSVLLAERICDILLEIATIKEDILLLELRVSALEEAILALEPPDMTIPTVNVSCLGGTEDNEIGEAVDLIAVVLCNMVAILGTVNELGTSITKECLGLAESEAFTGGVMSDIPGWVSTPLTIADTITNIWLTICDMRDSLTNVNTEILPKCKDVSLNFNALFTPDRSEMTVTLFNYAYIPDVPHNPASSIIVTDGITVDVRPINPYLMSISSAQNEVFQLIALGMDITREIVVTVIASLEFPEGTCEKRITKDFDYTCIVAPPTSVVVVAQSTSAFISWTAPSTPEPVIDYKYTLLNDAGISIVSLRTTTEGATIGSLEPGKEYTVKVVANFKCGVSEEASTVFSTKCYQITSVFAYFDPCISSTSEDYLGGQITISEIAEQDVDFVIHVKYYLPGGSCGSPLNQDLTGSIPQGQSLGIANACSYMISIPGATICSTEGELLSGCGAPSATGNCSSPSSLIASILS